MGQTLKDIKRYRRLNNEEFDFLARKGKVELAKYLKALFNLPHVSVCQVCFYIFFVDKLFSFKHSKTHIEYSYSPCDYYRKSCSLRCLWSLFQKPSVDNSKNLVRV